MAAGRPRRPARIRRPSRLFVTGTAACAVLLAGTALLPAGARIPAWGLLDAAYLAGFAAVILAATPAQAAALIVTDALIERFGLLTIIVLGETLAGVVTGLAGEPISGLTLAVGLVAVAVGFGAWWTYFDFAGHRHPIPKPVASLRWMLSHLPLTAAIAAMGAAMVSRAEGAEVLRAGAGAQRERPRRTLMRTVRAECLDWLLTLGRDHLERVLRVYVQHYVQHYNRHRPHRALRLEPPDQAAPGILMEDHPALVHRHDLLGGLLHEYQGAA